MKMPKKPQDEKLTPAGCLVGVVMIAGLLALIWFGAWSSWRLQVEAAKQAIRETSE